jgi:D-glucuronyl C5-epimerase C-terminus
VLAAIDRQASSGHLRPADASSYRSTVQRTARLASLLSSARAAVLRSQLSQAAAIAPKLTAPRAAAIFGQLAANDDWFARHGPVAPQTDITDGDGIVYRYFPGHGFEFHPLGNFAALNAAVAAKNVAATARLATALAARGVPESGGGTGFEYYFDYGGGRAPWTSGFAQAVAAQAFARAAALDTADSETLLAAARAAYRAIPGRLVHQTSFGPWIKLYSFNRAVVLNAQLQSAISLADYAKAVSDAGASAFATGLENAAARALPEFNNGFWSYYQLPADPSPVNYQDYVVQLLQTLAKRDDRFAPAATQFGQFGTTPPVFRLANAGVGGVTFWVSKPSTVRVAALGGLRTLSVGGGWHTVSFALPKRAGIFPVTIHATDWEGNSASVDALPIVHVFEPPSKHTHKPKPKRAVTSAASATLPPLVAGAGLGQPTQAAAAAAAGYGAVRMTLVWPAGSSVPDAGAIAALDRLPSSANLVLELYVASWPSDDTGRAALASYAASVAAQVPTLHDLVVGPGPASTSAPGYEGALAAVYDGVKAAAPLVRVDGALDGALTPKATLGALAAAIAGSGRTTPLMDELDFTPAPAAGKNLWPLASLATLVTALGTTFPGLPVIVDGLTADTFPTALTSSACRSSVVAVILASFADSTDALAQAAAAAQAPSRGCTSATPTPPAAPAPAPSPAPSPSPAPTPSPAPSPSPAPAPSPAPPPPPAPPPTTAPSTPAKATAVAASNQLVFPAHISTSTPPSVHLGCTAACLYLVTLQRSADGVPVLARRGSIARAGARTVTLPKVRIAAGSYRFSVWVVGAANPGPVTVERSEAVGAG